MTKTVEIYTDGSKTPTRCGYGIYFPNRELNNVSELFTIEPLTSNRAELYAIIQSIKILENNNLITDNTINIYTDSEYSIMCVKTWIHIWISNGWKTASNKQVKNIDLIYELSCLLIKYTNIHISYVPGHVDKHNIVADKLAKGIKN